MDYLEDIGLFSFTRKFSYSLKGQAQTLRKCYIIDNGIRYAYGFRFSEDIGKTLENSVFLELKRRKAQNPFFNIFYWRNTKSEIDFVLMENTKVVTLIQVCSNIDDFRTKEREFSSLLKASKEFDCKDLLIITLDYEGEENIKGRNIKILPFWLWAISTNVFNHSSKFC
ncbi:ATP-binding protein [bacterium]|nr:ATP-binding protein [bacterium]